MKKALFILRRRENYGKPEDPHPPEYLVGLLNSATFVNDMLKANGFESNIAIAIDGNCLDQIVQSFKPDVVFLEAIVFPPDKVRECSEKYTNITWVVRNHSESPFLGNEGKASDWLWQYAQIPRVFVSSNSRRGCQDVEIITEKKVVFLPNYYTSKTVDALVNTDEAIHIGCFGAVRPFKNHFLQALAAIEYADSTRQTLHFHINGTRIEQGGNGALKNIIALFARSKHKLVAHPWMTHENFCAVVKSMDVVMAVSFTESFCIVAADAVSQDVPVVASPEVFWLDGCRAHPTSRTSMIHALVNATDPTLRGKIRRQQQEDLECYLISSQHTWTEFLHSV